MPTNYRFAGMEYDSETGFYHTWFRQYDPNQGRWISVDPLPGSADDPQSLDRYSYVLDDPVNLSDPFGLRTNCRWEWFDSYTWKRTLSRYGDPIIDPEWELVSEFHGFRQVCEGPQRLGPRGGAGPGGTPPPQQPTLPQDCAKIEGTGGFVEKGVTRYEFNSAGFLIGIAFNLAGERAVPLAGGGVIPPATYGGVRLEGPGVISLGFTNPIPTPE